MRRVLMFTILGGFAGSLVACGGQSTMVNVTISVSITNKRASLVAGGTFTFDAVVMGDKPNKGVTWSISPSSGGGTLTNAAALSVKYNAPPMPPANNSVTVTATSLADSSKSDSVTFTLSPNPLTVLKGQYAFQVSGVSTSFFFMLGPPPNPLVSVGSILADGSGHITSGSMDLNGLSELGPLSVSGTYTLDENLRGTVNITTNTLNVALFVIMNSTGDEGIVLEHDQGSESGIIRRQASTLPTLPDLIGDTVAELKQAVNAYANTVMAGRFTVGAGGALSNGVVDLVTSFPLVGGALTGAIDPAGPDANGRGTLTLTPQGQTSEHYVYYAVNADKLLLMSTDPLNFFAPAAGVTTRQKTPLQVTDLDSTSVFQLLGSPEGSTSPLGGSVFLGIMTGNSANSSVSGNFDANDGGNVTLNASLTGTINSFDASTGRGTLSIGKSGGAKLFDLAFYLTSSGNGVLIETSLANNGGHSGTFVNQSVGSFSNASLSGKFLATFLPFGNGFPTAEALIDANPNATAVTGTVDTAVALKSVEFVEAPLTGTYTVVGSNGRGTAVLPGAIWGPSNPNPTANCVFYLIAPNQFLLIGTDANVGEGNALPQ